MFGMGFMEILLIAVVAIIALGPEKLPNAMVEIAKFIKKLKNGIDDAKSTINNELNISEMKDEANKFRAQIEDVKSIARADNLDLGIDKILNDDDSNKKDTNEKVSFNDNTTIQSNEKKSENI